MIDIELLYCNFADKHCKTQPEFPTALEAFQAAYNLREQEVQRLREALEAISAAEMIKNFNIDDELIQAIIKIAKQALQETTNKD